MLRKIVFWAHLCSGVAAGLVILMMSLTGVLLTFERQILAWAESAHYVPASGQTNRLSLEQLRFIGETGHEGVNAGSIVVTNHPGAPVSLSAGRRGGVSLNPYTGQAMETGSPALEAFFSNVTGIHRWFNMTGDSRNTARAITGASNLAFLFLLLSGLYLWLPSTWRWGMVKVRLLFRNTGGNSRARDFNWHHVFGIWSAIPLVFVVATASVFYYPWANDLVYQVYGEQPPARGRGGPPPGQGNAGAQIMAGSVPLERPAFMTLDELFARAAEHAGDWRQISIALPDEDSTTVSFSIDQGNGGQPQHRHNLSLDRATGEIKDWEPFSSQSPGRQTRSIVRFLHTGEVLGIGGQAVAGLVSLAGVFMVWTGLALAFRRLIVPLYRRKAS